MEKHVFAFLLFILIQYSTILLAQLNETDTNASRSAISNGTTVYPSLSSTQSVVVTLSTGSNIALNSSENNHTPVEKLRVEEGIATVLTVEPLENNENKRPKRNGSTEAIPDKGLNNITTTEISRMKKREDGTTLGAASLPESKSDEVTDNPEKHTGGGANFNRLNAILFNAIVLIYVYKLC